MGEIGSKRKKIVIPVPPSFNESENRVETVVAGDKKITLIKYHGKFHACAHLCPHAGGVLGGGRIDQKGNIICPLHGYRFDIKTGRNSSGEGFHLKIFKLEEKPRGLEVELE